LFFDGNINSPSATKDSIKISVMEEDAKTAGHIVVGESATIPIKTLIEDDKKLK
jgi:hypothetical protein